LADGGFQFWNSETVSWKASEDWKLALDQEMRFDTSGAGFFYEHTDLGAIHSGIADWMDLEAHYRVIGSRAEEGWECDHVIHAGVLLKNEWKGVNFISRNRIEYRNQENDIDGWRYRLVLTAKLPALTDLKIRPYMADEVIIDFVKEKMTENRVTVGLELPVYKALKGNIYYVWQCKNSNSHWIDTNVLGAKLKLSF